MRTAEAHARALLMGTPSQQMSIMEILPKLLQAGFADVIHSKDGPHGFFNACVQLMIVGVNRVGIAPAVEGDQEVGAPEGAEGPHGVQEVPRDDLQHRAEICDDDPRLRDLLAHGGPGCKHTLSAAKALLRAQGEHAVAKAALEALEGDDQPDEDTMKEARKFVDEMAYVSKMKMAQLRRTGRYWILMEVVAKATEFRYDKKAKNYVFRVEHNSPETRLKISEAERWFEKRYLHLAKDWDSWLPLDERLTHLQVSEPLRPKRGQSKYIYTGFIDGGVGILVPEAWVLAMDLENVLQKCKRPDMLGHKVLIGSGAAAGSRVESRIADTLENSADISCLNSVRDSSHGAGAASSRSEDLNLQERDLPDIMFRQGKKKHCAFYGLASALHFAGYTDQAAKLVDSADASVERVGDTLKDSRLKCVELFPRPGFKVVNMEVVQNERNGTPISPLNFSPDFFLNIQFQDSEKYCGHSIAIHQNLIFDSNKAKAIPLTKEGLDSCCLKKGDRFFRVWKGYTLFRPLLQGLAPR